jgi:hypothetical protein
MNPAELRHWASLKDHDTVTGKAERDQLLEHAQLIEDVRDAVTDLKNISIGLTMAYDAAAKKFIDEALLHIGHHQAQLQKVLKKLEA